MFKFSMFKVSKCQDMASKLECTNNVRDAFLEETNLQHPEWVDYYQENPLSKEAKY
jgi:hypothetical protein